MTAKEYLSQAFWLDRQINSKLEQVAALRELATKTSVQNSDMPGNPNRNTDKLEKTVVKIIDLENKIDGMIDELVDLKLNITNTILVVEDTECRVLLEMRYLCFKNWEEIAVSMGYDIRHIYRLHQAALTKVKTCQ